MNIRQKRLADAIRTYASEDIITYEQLRNHNFGIISVIEVEVSPDYEYADIYVHSQSHTEKLPHFLAPIEPLTRKRIIKDFGLRRTPHLRYRIGKKQTKTSDILTLIQSLDEQYGLSRENS